MTTDVRLIKVIQFLRREFPTRIQCFYTPDMFGDTKVCIYDKDGITVDFCPNYNYIEIFGLTKEDYRQVVSAVGTSESDFWS